MTIIKAIILILIGFSSGIVISGAVFAFIAIIGIVPRLAQKTKTEKYVMLYEEAIIFGGIFGAGDFIFDYHIPINTWLIVFYMLCVGVFYGCLAVSRAEVLDVIPILSRRGRIEKGMKFFLLALAIGKLTGSVLYSFVPGFYLNE